MSNTTNTESFAQLFEESLAKQEMRQGEVITAEVLRVEHNFVVVNAGLKSEAYVPVEEFKDDLGQVTFSPATSFPWQSNRPKTASAKRSCPVTRPSVWQPG